MRGRESCPCEVENVRELRQSAGLLCRRVKWRDDGDEDDEEDVERGDAGPMARKERSRGEEVQEQS